MSGMWIYQYQTMLVGGCTPNSSASRSGYFDEATSSATRLLQTDFGLNPTEHDRRRHLGRAARQGLPPLQLLTTGSEGALVNRTLTVAAPVGALVAGLVLVPAAPSSAWGLNDVATLAPSGASVVVASDPGGNAAAAWVAGGQVQVARRPVGSSTWTPAVTVSPAGVSATDPDVSVGPTGVAAVVWVAAGDVQVAVQPTGQPWGAARNVSDNPTWSDTDPQVEVGPAGIATVVWAGQNAASTIVRSKTASAASISAQDALTPQVTGTFSGLSLARNAAGDAVAAWRWDGAGGSYVQAARRLNGAAWSAPQAQGTVPSVADAPSVTLDGSGNAALGWGSGPTADTNLPYVATWPRGGNLGGPVGLSAAPARRVALAESADGRLAAAWSSPSGLMYADVGAPAFALSTGPVSSHAVAFSDTGAATVVWTAAGGGLAVAHRPSGGLWTSVPVPSVAGSVPWVAAHGIDATVVVGRRGGRPGPGPHPRRRRPDRRAPDRAPAGAQRGHPDQGRLDRRRHLVADPLRGPAPGGDLPHRARCRRDVAHDDGDGRGVQGRSRGRPCACACAAATRPATSGPGRSRGARRRR